MGFVPRLCNDDERIEKILLECENYRKELVFVCLRYFKCERECAEDCVQEAYVALYENLKSGVIINNYKGWLFAVALNYKNKEMKQRAELNELKEKICAEAGEMTYEPYFADGYLSDNEVDFFATKIVSSLTPEEKELYTAHYLCGSRLKDIAAQNGVSYEAMRKRHIKLKKKLSLEIEKCDF